jgi:hypothetical protein
MKEFIIHFNSSGVYKWNSTCEKTREFNAKIMLKYSTQGM